MPRSTAAREGTPNAAARNGGENGLGASRIRDIQRARMLAATVEVVAERGVANVSVTHVVARAGVSRRTFYEQFVNREDCVLAAFDDAVGLLAARVLAAYERAGTWRERIRAALLALLELLDEEPSIGRLLIVESLAAGPRVLERRGRALARAIAAIDEGRGDDRAGSAPVQFTAEGVVGAVLAVLHGRLTQRKPGRMTMLVNPLMSIIVLPYLGPATARRELSRPLPRPGDGAATRHTGHNALEHLDMRLTYRTVRVLSAVAEHPGASNRTIGTEAGMSDQGQISKLLARLQKLGLIANDGEPAPGTPNAWALTELGEDVHGAIPARA
jgi:AcrR family transcriptional regulator